MGSTVLSLLASAGRRGLGPHLWVQNCAGSVWPMTADRAPGACAWNMVTPGDRFLAAAPSLRPKSGRESRGSGWRQWARVRVGHLQDRCRAETGEALPSGTVPMSPMPAQRQAHRPWWHQGRHISLLLSHHPACPPPGSPISHVHLLLPAQPSTSTGQLCPPSPSPATADSRVWHSAPSWTQHVAAPGRSPPTPSPDWPDFPGLFFPPNPFPEEPSTQSGLCPA